MSTEIRRLLSKAFEAGFQWCASGTDKHGEYNGGEIEFGFQQWLAGQEEPPAPPVLQEEKDLARVDQSALSPRQDLPRSPQPDGSQ